MRGTVLITGASAGIGAAIAERMYHDGWNLILLARRKERLESLKKKLSSSGDGKIHLIAADITDRDTIRREIGAIPAEFLPVEVLVNNAGLGLGLEPAWETALEDWDTMVETNIKGLMFMTRLILPGMVERNKGHIVNFGSIAGSWPYPGGNVYGSTKAFVQQFSRNLRTDLLGHRVRVTNIEPGIVETDFSVVRFKGDEEKAGKVYENADPLLPEDMAEIVAWVTSLPERVNINSVEVMPVTQAWGPLSIHRKR
jgi:NADP-dependent 3-hydroxy acid dehydrogenase YdfG